MNLYHDESWQLPVPCSQVLHRLIYGTQRYQLFPPIQKIKNINNVKQQKDFPVNCAADDLDLGFGESDQIELFNHPSKDTLWPI